MLVDNVSNNDSLTTRLQTVANKKYDSSSEFSQALSAVESIEESSASNTSSAGNKSSKSDNAHATTEELLKKLNEYIEKGPIVVMREKILESMGITEEELKAMPADKQKAIEAEIVEKIKEMLLEQQEKAGTQQAAAMAQTADIYSSLTSI